MMPGFGHKIILIAAVAGVSAQANRLDLTLSGAAQGTLAGVVGGTAIFSRSSLQPAGTGVFQPFLTLDSHGSSTLEQGYNSTAADLPLNDLRPPWNQRLRLGDIGTVDLDGHPYFIFTLDANEPGSATARNLSIDNIQIYTAPDDGSAATSNPAQLGDLRFALNNLSTDPAVLKNWVKIDASLGPNTGSGDADLYVYIPADSFKGLDPNLSVYFYNLNGAHEKADRGTGATAGYEEWRVDPPVLGVPETGGTLVLLLTGAIALLSCGHYPRR